MKTVRFRYLCWGKIGLRDCFTFQILRERWVGTKFFNSTRRTWTDESLIFCEVSCESFNRSDQIKVQIGDEVNDSAGCCTCEDPPTMNTIKVLPGSFEWEPFPHRNEWTCWSISHKDFVIMPMLICAVEDHTRISEHSLISLVIMSILICAVEDHARISEHSLISFRWIMNTPPILTSRSNWRFSLLIKSLEGSTLVQCVCLSAQPLKSDQNPKKAIQARL